LLCPFCPHVCEEVWERLGVKGFISLAKWPKVDESKVISDGKIVDLNSKIIEDVRGIIEKFPGRENVYVYVMPFELDRIDVGKISEVIGKEVRVFAVNDSGKYDPEGKAKKAKPGKASVYVE